MNKERGGETVSRLAHNQKKAGSTPARATTSQIAPASMNSSYDPVAPLVSDSADQGRGRSEGRLPSRRARRRINPPCTINARAALKAEAQSSGRAAEQSAHSHAETCSVGFRTSRSSARPLAPFNGREAQAGSRSGTNRRTVTAHCGFRVTDSNRLGVVRDGYVSSEAISACNQPVSDRLSLQSRRSSPTVEARGLKPFRCWFESSLRHQSAGRKHPCLANRLPRSGAEKAGR